MSRSTWVLALALPAALALAQQPAAPPAGKPPATAPDAPSSLLLVPWLEVDSRVPGSVDGCVRGLRQWQEVTDTAMVSVGPADLEVYATLEQRVPRMKFIPGLKTSGIITPAGLDSVEGWATIARAARAACLLTGSTMFVLENESAIQSYVDGKYEVKWDRLQAALRQFPSELTMIWSPSLGDEGERLQRYTRLCQAVQDTCNVRFLDYSISTPDARTSDGQRRTNQRLAAVARAPTLPMVYCYGNKYWPDERISEAVGLAQGDMVLVYPSAKHWEAAAQYVADHASALPKRVKRPAAAASPPSSPPP